MAALEWLSDTPLAEAFTDWPALYIVVNAGHILSIGLLAGAILPLDLRVLGLLRHPALGDLAPFLSRAALTGAVLAIVTGALLFTVNAPDYARNPAFLIKLGLVAAGCLNAVLLHRSAAWQRTLQTGAAPGSVKCAAALSLILWPAAILAGRWIGFL